jgi:hypothetical protein
MTNQPAAVPPPVHTGRCLCGAVRYELHGPLRPVVACHCGQCRRTSGHFAASTAVSPEKLRLIEDHGLRWYESSVMARRGFCGYCGSNLFWAPASGERIAVMAGTLDKPTGLAIVMHIFVDDAGDYYRLTDGLPTHRDGDHGIPVPDA